MLRPIRLRGRPELLRLDNQWRWSGSCWLLLGMGLIILLPLRIGGLPLRLGAALAQVMNRVGNAHLHLLLVRLTRVWCDRVPHFVVRRKLCVVNPVRVW